MMKQQEKNDYKDVLNTLKEPYGRGGMFFVFMFLLNELEHFTT